MRLYLLIPLLTLLSLQRAHARVDVCDPNPCTSPPENECLDTVTLLQFDPIGMCTDLGGSFGCDYTFTNIDCSELGQVCASGECVDQTPVPSLAEGGVSVLAGLLFAVGFCALHRRRTR
jgi:hypothetical protein